MKFNRFYKKLKINQTGLCLGFFLISLVGLLTSCSSFSTFKVVETEPAPTRVPANSQIQEQPVNQNKIPASIRFTKIDSNDGLSQSTTYSIVQDDLGFMWYGTDDGLNRYDGYNFTVFTPKSSDQNSLSDRWITSLLSAGDGDLWIGTRQGGLNYYDSRTGIFTRYLNNEEDPSSLSSNNVNMLYFDQKGNLWIGTKEGLDLFLQESKTFKRYSFESLDKESTSPLWVNAIFEDNEGLIWVGTGSSGLFRLNPTNGISRQFLNDPLNTHSLTSDNIRSILSNGKGELWVATDAGLNLFDPATGLVIRYTHSDTEEKSLSDDRVRAMIIDHEGILWVGTSNGLNCYDAIADNFVRFMHDPIDTKSLSADSVLAIYESSEDVLWVSTYGGYLNKYYRGMDRFTYYHTSSMNPGSIGGNTIFKIDTDDDGFVWIATNDGGLSRLNPASGKFLNYKHDPEDEKSLSSNVVWSVYKDSMDVLWVGTNAGLDRLDPGSEGFYHYDDSSNGSSNYISGLIYDIVEDQSGDLWFGTSDGLSRYNQEFKRFVHYQYSENNPHGISDSNIMKVYVDNSGNLWLGTFSHGLDRFDAATDQFIQYLHDPEDETSLSNDSVLSVFQDHLGRIWVGTDGGGLDLLNASTNTFTHFTEEDGLPSNVIYGILEDDFGKLWLSTNKGISLFNPEDLSFLNFNESDGLQGNEFNMNAYAESNTGIMYFGGINGLNSFDPRQIVPSVFLPPVVLTSITQSGKVVSPGIDPNRLEQLTLKWPYNSFEFSFASLSFADPKKNQYAYKLVGFDQNWINANSWREGRYTNLSGGTYTLMVKGSNEDGVWNEAGHSLIVKVIPAFWQTLWFQISAALFVFGITLGIFRLRSAGVKANTKKLEQQVSERTKEIERLFVKTKELAVVEERNRLARELHDSAKQKAFAALAQLGTASGVLPDHPESARSHLQEAENLVYEVIEELTFLIQEMYPLALKEKGLATSLRDYVFDWEARTDIQVQVNIEQEKRLSLDIEQAVYRAIQEALSNIARHSKASSVKISLAYTDDEITAVICDNGCGFDPKTRQTGMGLRTIRERMESQGGSLELDSGIDRGTCLTLKAPVKSHQLEKGAENDESHLNHTGG